MIDGINHITFAVSNLERSISFYSELLGLELVARWPQGAYLKAGKAWIALNLDRECRKGPVPDYTHIAFNVPPEKYGEIKARLEGAGIRPFKENKSEGASFYFFDPDGHKLELHSNTLEQRLEWMKGKGVRGLEILQ